MSLSSTVLRSAIALSAGCISMLSLGCGHKEAQAPPAAVVTGQVPPIAAKFLNDPKMTPEGKAYITEHLSSLQPKNTSDTSK